MFEDDTDQVYLVVRNGEEQYSIWPRELAVPELDSAGVAWYRRA